MSHMDKRSVTLSEDLAQTVDDAVAAGEYASANDVISDALRQWKERRDLFGYSAEELRRLIQEGIDSGPGRFVTMDEIIAEAHLRSRRGSHRNLGLCGPTPSESSGSAADDAVQIIRVLHGRRDITTKDLS
jgi:antitoxin ParD1/3/4